MKNIYGSSIYKCDRPGCPAYRIGFDTRSKRDGHKQRHTRPFKCQISECPFANLGFATKVGLESHLAQNHVQSLHIVPTAVSVQTSTSDEEELKAILIDAVQESDLSTIRAEASAVRTHILDLLLSAYQGRSSDAMIKHLLDEIPSDLKFSNSPGAGRSWELYNQILRASVDHGNHDVFRIFWLFSIWLTDDISRKNSISSTLSLIGRTRRADLIEIVVSNLWIVYKKRLRGNWSLAHLLIGIIPGQPDAQAEIMALECLERFKPHVSGYSDRLLLAVARGCCSVVIAEFLCAEGARVEWAFGGSRPILPAAKQTSLEAAKLMEFLLKKGAKSTGMFKGKPLSDFPGPRNIHKWIGITWEELVEAQGSAKRS